MKKKNKIFVLFITFLFSLISSVIIIFSYAQSEVVFELSTEIEDLLVGDTFNVPSGSFNRGTTKKQVLLPNGTLTNLTSFKTDSAGIYTVIYSTDVGGETYTHEEKVNVYNKLYSVDSTYSTVSFTDNMILETVNDGVKSTVTKTGLDLVLTEGAVFTYNKIHNISNNTQFDSLFKINVLPKYKGQVDCENIYVRFVDVYDDKNYFDFVANQHMDGASEDIVGAVYTRCGASNQDVNGVNYINKENVDVYGTWTPLFSFSNGIEDQVNDYIEASIDYATKKVYNSVKAESINLTMDMQSTKLNTYAWDGFTTGECYVQIFAKNLRGAEVHLFIQSLFDDDMSSLNNVNAYDTEIPNLTVDTQGYGDNLPNAVVGYGYNLFNATARDLLSGVKQVKTNVYFNYNSSSCVNVSVENGKFVPQKEGVYTIVYSVEDYFGNTSEVSYDVFCREERQIELSFVGEYETEIPIGSELKVADIAYENTSGKVNVEIKAVNGNETYTVDRDTLSFIPLSKGNFIIEYEISDGVGQTASIFYNVSVVDNELPVFLSKPVIPKYLICGYENKLEDLEVYDFNNEKVINNSKIFVEYNGNERVEAVNGIIIPREESTDYSAKIIYSYTSSINGKTSELAYPVICKRVKDGSNKVKRYLAFYGDGADCSYLENSEQMFYYALFTATEGDKHTVDFVNKLSIYNFSVKFNINQGGFKVLNLKLTDSLNSEQSITFSFVKEQDEIVVKINGTGSYSLTGYSFENSLKSILLNIDYSRKNLLLDNGNIKINIADILKEDYFSNGLCYLTFEMEDVSDESSILLKELCSTSITTSSNIPNSVIAQEKEYKYSYEKGEVVKISKMNFANEIIPYYETSLTVYGTKGEILKDINGLTLQNVKIDEGYEIVLAEYGSYKFSYKYGNNEYSVMIFVRDIVPPTFTFINDIKDNYKINDSVTVNANGVDAIDGNVSVYVSVMNPNGTIELIQNGTTYKFTQKGKYYITAFGYDSANNYGFVRKTVSVN